MKWRLGFLAVLFLCVLMLPLSGGAETQTGKCGTNLTWTLDDEGTLTIQGTGKMFDVDNDQWNTRWNSKQVVHAVIEYGVTSIGNYAFNCCESLLSVAIPESVEYIGNNALSWCTSLTSVFIPKSVANIGEHALSYCRSMTDIEVSNENVCFSSVEGVLFNKDQTILIACPGGKAGIYSVPDGVLNIGYCAFLDCQKLTAIDMPDSVVEIENAAFSTCINISNITLSNNITKIGNYAFNMCFNLPALSLPQSVKYIGDYAFAECHALSKLSIAGDQLEIGKEIFYEIRYYEGGIPPTIYCYAYTSVDEWATENKLNRVYLDFEGIDNVRSVSLLTKNHFLEIGSSRSISFNVFPNDDHPIIAWKSSDPTIISVENGIAVAHSEGKATIYATVDSASSGIEMIAYAPDTFALSPAEVWMVAKKDVHLSVPDVWIENGVVFWAWTSSDTKLATVDCSGKVTTNFPGDVIICADSEEGLHAEALLHLCYPVTEISFSSTINPMQLGQNHQLIANVTMRTQNCVNHLVTFTSSDETIAAVDENGLVTPSKPGTVTITATADSGVSASCTVIVTDLAYTFSILPTGLNMIEEEAFAGLAFEAVIIPEGCILIGPRAFADCVNLVYIRIPASMTEIAEDAFEGCPNVLIDCGTQ